MHKNKILITAAILLTLSLNVFAENVTSFQNTVSTNTQYQLAHNKFALANVNTAHNDFSDIIDNADSTTFPLLNQAISLAEYGFFDLTDKIFSKVDDFEISENYIKDIKQFYYPSKKLQQEDILQLAEAYANIMYNNYAQETILDLVNSSTLMQHDYTYYILALAFYETKDFEQALNYISMATSQNNNINYKILKTKILLEVNQKKLAIKQLEDIKKNKIQIPTLTKKIEALEQYVLYKISKNENSKDLHLGYYYYLEEKNNFAQNILLDGISNNPKINGEIYSLLAIINQENGSSKTEDYAKKAIRTGFERYQAPFILALIKLDENNTKSAHKLLTKASNLEKGTYFSKLKQAELLKNNKKNKQASKILLNIVKKQPNNYLAYYNLATLDEENAEKYLKKTLSYNVNYAPAYEKLCEIYTNREHFNLAKKYANNLKYIDEKDFKYYYYFSKIESAMGNTSNAEMYLEQCKIADPSYRDKIDEGL